MIGESGVIADAECIFTCVDFLREVGLGPQDVQVHVGSRRLIAAILREAGLAEDTQQKLLPVLDRKRKLPPEGFREQVLAAGGQRSSSPRLTAT